MRHRLSLLVAWFGLGVVLVSGVTALAQGQRRQGAPPPRIVTGDDLGFRVDGTDPRTGNPTGTWMIRVGGEWMEVGNAGMVRPAR